MNKKAILKSQRTGEAFYRDRLTKDEIEFYELLLDGLIRCEPSIPYKNLEIKQIERIYEALRLEEPLLFFVEKISCQHLPVLRCGSVIPQYRFQKDKVQATTDAIQTKLEEISRKLYGKSEYEKEMFIHDFVCKSVKYDYAFKESSFECVGPLLFGKGVCEGISKATKLILNAVGISSIIVQGKSSEQQINGTIGDSHAWNIVKINGLHYHVDFTFDLSVMVFDVLRYDYFNLSDKEIASSHIYDRTFYPRCNTSKDYYADNGMYIQKKSLFESYLEKKIRCGERNILFKLPHVADFRNARENVFSITRQCIAKYGGSVQYQFSYNEDQRVFLLHVE